VAGEHISNTLILTRTQQELGAPQSSNFLLGEGKWGGANSVPIFSFPFVSPLPSKDWSNARSVNEQSTQCTFVPFRRHSQSKHYWDLWPIVSFSEKAKMCLEEQ